jgi:hypothetical protein
MRYKHVLLQKHGEIEVNGVIRCVGDVALWPILVADIETPVDGCPGSDAGEQRAWNY